MPFHISSIIQYIFSWLLKNTINCNFYRIMRFNHPFHNYTHSLAPGHFQLKVNMMGPETRAQEKEGVESVNKETKVKAIA